VNPPPPRITGQHPSPRAVRPNSPDSSPPPFHRRTRRVPRPSTRSDSLFPCSVPPHPPFPKPKSLFRRTPPPHPSLHPIGLFTGFFVESCQKFPTVFHGRQLPGKIKDFDPKRPPPRPSLFFYSQNVRYSQGLFPRSIIRPFRPPPIRLRS